jgi:hypothetical protein
MKNNPPAKYQLEDYLLDLLSGIGSWAVQFSNRFSCLVH